MQKHNSMGEVKDTLTINGREAVTVTRAMEILYEVTGHPYTRDSVYRMLERGAIEAERTETTNFYYVDSLKRFQPQRNGGRKKGQSAYPASKRKEALEIYEQGEKNFAVIGERISVSRQVVRNWILGKPQKKGN